MIGDWRGGNSDGMAREVVQVMPRLGLWELDLSRLSSEERDGLVDPDHLQVFALDELESIPLADLVLDAIVFEKLYGSQRFWLCHFCGSYFSDCDSLTTHLKVEHISWPSLLHKPDREFVQGSVFKMVWKPINVEHAVRSFYSLCLHARLLQVELGELPWPWSDDDPERSKLLTQLEQVLKDLTSDEHGLSFLSSGLLRHLISVASRHILVRLPGRDHVLDFTRQLTSSPLSFCFLDNESLFHFLQVAEHMSQIVKKFSALDKCNSTSCNMTGDSSINYRLYSLLSSEVYFILGHVNCQDQKLSDIPCTGPLQLPSEIPEFLAQLALSSDFCCNNNKLIMDESIPCFYTVYGHLLRNRPDQPLLQFPLHFKNEEISNWCSQITYLEKEMKDDDEWDSTSSDDYGVLYTGMA